MQTSRRAVCIFCQAAAQRSQVRPQYRPLHTFRPSQSTQTSTETSRDNFASPQSQFRHNTQQPRRSGDEVAARAALAARRREASRRDDDASSASIFGASRNIQRPPLQTERRNHDTSASALPRRSEREDRPRHVPASEKEITIARMSRMMQNTRMPRLSTTTSSPPKRIPPDSTSSSSTPDRSNLASPSPKSARDSRPRSIVEPSESTSSGQQAMTSRSATVDDDRRHHPERASRRTRGRYSDRDDQERRPRRARPQRDNDMDEVEASSSRRARIEPEDESDPDFQAILAVRNARKQAKLAKKQRQLEAAALQRQRRNERMTPIRIPDFVTMTRLAQMLRTSHRTLSRTMTRLGFGEMAPDHVISAENAGLAAIEHNFDPSAPEQSEKDSRDLFARDYTGDATRLPPRPPVVAIMGHVDHGKTTLLDYLRQTSVAAGEFGGITQHIGAFSVNLSAGKTITFLDTPGHAAFLAMRQRGATVTDIIILVVAADDSVKPQTIEALKHAKDAGVPIIVAINKIDKEEADVQRVKNDLARHGVEIEEFGGDTQVICVSGKTGQGMDELEEAAVTLSEILDHRADPKASIEGWVIEATTKTSGRAATVLVRQGTIRVGDVLVAGKSWGRVRVLRNEAGQPVDSALPGTPVEVEGWRSQPVAGDEVLEAPSEQKAIDVVAFRESEADRVSIKQDVEAINKTRVLEQEKRRLEQAAADGQDKASVRAQDGSQPTTVPFIIKADVSGSSEAVNDYLLQMTNPICSPTVLRSAVGPVSEFDIEHAAVANGHIIAFNIPRDPQSISLAEKKGVQIIHQNVIYRVVSEVKEVLESKLPPLLTQRVIGEAEVASTFEIGVGGRKVMRVAGCRVRNGSINRSSRVRVLRGDDKLFDGAITSLKHVKKDVQEMRKGTECGLAFGKWQDFQAGDVVQTYEETSEKRTLPI